MTTWRRTLAIAAARTWAWLRAASGDDAYEAYLSRRRHGIVLTRQEFYLERLRLRYSGLNRCC